MIINSRIFGYLDKKGETVDLGEALGRQAQKERVSAVPLSGTWLSVDTPERYAHAVNKALTYENAFIKNNKPIIEPLINRHAAWIVMNPVQGCMNNCSYCFLQKYGTSTAIPKVIATPSESVKSLIESKYYREDIPVCMFTSTDIFSTDANIQYLREMVNYLSLLRVVNPIVLVTKCKIPDRVVQLLKESQLNIVVYLSYSGLPHSIERNISEKDIKENFKNLYEAHIPIIHYFRPIVPQNSSIEDIKRILDYVHQFSSVSVITGLKVSEEYQEHLSFWPEITNDPRLTGVECVWPTGAQNRIKQYAQSIGHYIFETNSCALAYVLKTHDQYGFFGGKQCQCNLCPKEMVRRCKTFYATENELDSTAVSRIISLDSLPEGYQSHEIVEISENITNEDLCQLRYLLHKEVVSLTRSEGMYWGTSVTGKGGISVGD